MASSKKLRHGELPERLDTFLTQAVAPGQTLVLGLSGGLDSCVLLHLLAAARAAHVFELHALHVNHGISPHADGWERFCADLCASCRVPFSSAQVTVPRDSGLGTEAAAREARYRVLLAHPADAIVLAHHRDDQAETLLLQLLRGAGVKGMAGMGSYQRSAISGQRQPATPSPSLTPCPLPEGEGDLEGWGEGGKVILRPLLDVPRTALEAYAQFHDLRWIEDESNLDLAYDRNFLRHHIFPELEKRFPASRTTLARSAAHFAEAAELLDEVAAGDAARLLRQGRLDVAGLRALSAPRAKNLLRFWLAGHLSSAPNTRRLQEIYRQLLDARHDAQLSIALEGGQVRRYRGEAFFEAAATVPQQPLEWHGEAELRLPGGRLQFRRATGAGLARVGEVLQIRYRGGGERFRPDSRRPTRSLRHLFQEAGVPPWERRTLPLIYAGDELVAVPGIGVACDFQAGAGEEGLLIEWVRD